MKTKPDFDTLYCRNKLRKLVESMAQNNSTAKVISILDYIGILWILGLFIEKDDQDVKFHTNQGLTLFLLEVVTGVFTALAVIPFVGFLFTIIGGILGIVCLVLAILGIVNAAQGQQKPLPVIGTMFSFIK